MNVALEGMLILAALFAAMIALQGWGKRLGERDRQLDPTHEKAGSAAAEAAVFGLLSLFLAFTFSGAGARFDARRQLIVEEANDIGTAWLRLDLLPADSQPELRELFRQYADARIETYRRGAEPPAAEAAQAKSVALQQEIWAKSVAAAKASGQTPTLTLLLPALNAMFDITTTRAMAARFHPPPVILGMVGVLALVGSIFAGYGMAGQRKRHWLHGFGFALVMTIALYVILDFEYPRLGLIRLEAADQVMVDVRHSMD